MKKDVQTEKYIKLTLDRREGNFAVCIASADDKKDDNKKDDNKKDDENKEERIYDIPLDSDASSLLMEIPEGNFFIAETDQEGNFVRVVDLLEKENQAERTRRAELRAKLFAKSKKHN